MEKVLVAVNTEDDYSADPQSHRRAEIKDNPTRPN